jgi:coenzyme F420-reducing hydrogenase delta subunit/formate hydrogenlyase subunit 6/NADH:ubiquinone oxidoreductase subunit I
MEEIDMSLESKEPRVGVFICRCGGQIDLSLDTKQLASFVEDEEDVVFTHTLPYLCHPSGMDEIAKRIEGERLDRIVVAACSPRLYQSAFQETIERAGLNRLMIDMANIREQVAWVHFRDREATTRKAEDMVAMSIAKVRNQLPDEHGNVSFVNKKRCVGCGVCESVCNVNAITLASDPEFDDKRKATVNPKACVGCGACVSACPTAAMDQTFFSNKQVLAQIEKSLSHKEDDSSFPNILVFSCHWCSYTSADQAGLMRMELDPHFRTVRTMCSARVDPEWVLKAIASGADGILVLAGVPGRCHYEIGNLRTRKRMTLLQMVLKQYGFDENRFQVKYVDSDQPDVYVRTVQEFMDKIKQLGPNPIEPTTILESQRVELPYLKL